MVYVLSYQASDTGCKRVSSAATSMLLTQRHIDTITQSQVRSRRNNRKVNCQCQTVKFKVMLNVKKHYLCSSKHQAEVHVTKIMSLQHVL